MDNQNSSSFTSPPPLGGGRGEFFSLRTELLLGHETMSLVAQKRVIIFGVGGVGSWCAEGLVRSGVEHLTIVDFDCVSQSNINRQLMATLSTVGKPKVEVLRERLLDINPDANIQAVQSVYSEETAESFHLEQYDYVLDCIDSLKDKAHLLLHATGFNATVFSSMGAALKINPCGIKVAEYWKVRGCPLGAALRKKMKRAKVAPAKPVMCVYSEELLENKGGKQQADSTTDSRLPNGSLVHITAIFGFTLAGLVMQDIVEAQHLAPQQQDKNI